MDKLLGNNLKLASFHPTSKVWLFTSDKALNDSSSTIKAFSSTFTSALTLFNDKTESDKVIPKLENLSFSKNNLPA